MLRNPQAPGAVVMIRPRHFAPNPETAADNAFQLCAPRVLAGELAQRAYAEVTAVAETLAAMGVRAHLFEDDSHDRPDAVFPNNWFSTHSGGHIAVYPMYAANRRRERRWDIIDWLKAHYRVQDVIDYSGLEADDIFLEGTGAMVLDHIDRVAYAAHSRRATALALERFCSHFNYEPVMFDARDVQGRAVYHTNVLMCIATEFVMMGIDMLSEPRRREQLRERFEQSGRTLIALSPAQVSQFAGNAIELQGRDGRLLALSRRARASLTTGQVRTIERSATLLPLDVEAIEHAGGSVRCMLAGVHLSERS